MVHTESVHPAEQFEAVSLDKLAALLPTHVSGAILDT
jgi:hypothetical protein